MMQRVHRFLLGFALILATTFTVRAQNVALKTNLLYDASATINLGLEFGLSQQWTLDVSGNYNPFTFNHNKKWKHWLVQPEFRYWFCDKFSGHFLGFHLLGGEYNVGNFNPGFKMFNSNFKNIRYSRYEGWFMGAGIAYGYTWVLGKHWNFEAEIGFGYAFSRYDKYECGHCGKKIASAKNHHYVGPTKAAINLVYVF